jgi:hypothetical protein
MRVAILGTGRMELRGLPPALESLFPGHEFYPIFRNHKDSEPFDSFTSWGRPLTLTQANPNLVEIVEEMASTLVPGRKGDPPDLLFVLEDLEIPNKQQPEVVVQVFREAAARHVEKLRSSDPKRADRVLRALRSKASFHLVTPMIEAWLFADPNGPRNAGVPEDRLLPNCWEQSRDPEDFLTRDSGYLEDDGSTCTAWRALPPRKAKEHKPGWHTEQREAHPKAFLKWLCRDPAEKNCTRYRETHEGADALNRLDWDAALNPSPDQPRRLEHCTYLRAFVEDLADGLGESPSWPVGGRVSPHTDHRMQRTTPMLRNI